MDIQVNTPIELVPLDPSAQRVLLLAAEIGAQITDDVFVSYTTLLLGLLFAKLDQDQMRVVGQEQATNVPAWHVEANRTLDVARILSEKSGLRREAVERSAVAVRAGEVTSSPSGRPLLSTSARDVLQQAAAVAAEKHGPQAAVTPADIMASYLYTIRLPINGRRSDGA